MSVCVGDEWYRYPSSFFLPGPAYRLQFVKSGFDGMLPLPFDASQVREDDSASMSPKLMLLAHAWGSACQRAHLLHVLGMAQQ